MKYEENAALKARRDQRTAVESASDFIEQYDILETITNVGNDEVFTPRKIAEEMLDSLPKEVWSNPNYKWLNPCTKNGIFEREIALRLDKGLEKVIPDILTRRKHILQNMIYAIGLTKFTSHVARRTLYYCNNAMQKCDGIKAKDGHYVNGYAIGNGSWFNTSDGNILTPIGEHKFVKDRCVFCNIRSNSKYVDPLQREQYAYEFIHYNKMRLDIELNKRFFNGDKTMKFDVIIGNPPYQLSDGGGTGSSAKPIYDKFVECAISLKPTYLCMITPSRWMTGGKGLDDYRFKMINDHHLLKLIDYHDSKKVFPNNDIKGGVCYFLWAKDYDGPCNITSYTANGKSESKRYLKEKDDFIFIRDENLLKIKNQVFKKQIERLSRIVSARKPYGLEADTMRDAGKYNLPKFSDSLIKNGYKIIGLDENGRRNWKFLPPDYPIPKISPCLDKYKVFIAKAYGCGAIGETISTPVLSTPAELCTETFLEIGPFNTELEASNLIKYIKTKFFRCLVGILKQTQNSTKDNYYYVPYLDFASNNVIDWTKSIADIDKQLFKMFELDSSSIDYINSNIEEMH